MSKKPPLPNPKCICCEKEVNSFKKEKPMYPQSLAIWKDSIVDEISANCGSKFDTMIFVIAICDTCIKEKLDKGVLVHSGNYM